MNHLKCHFLIRILVVFTIIFFFPSLLFGQRVALVLSGGGAKGLAHIGALKALEENHIPIDYVVGTSMGGIVGGLYAAGYSPEEMESIVTEPHFQNWLKGILSEQYTYFYSKRDPDASIFTLDLSVDSSFTTTVNNNLASDHAINFVFAEMLAQASQRSRNNFDSLMVPFRTVASDIFLQQEYILKGGYLNKAVRATMTVPLFYRPIKVHDKYLFDGGIYNNFPVDVAKEEFKTDYVIGINVGSKKLTEYPYDEDDKLMSESLAFLFLKKTDPKAVGRNGIYIEPDLSLYSSIKFENARTIIDSGYVETLKKIPEIKAAVARRVSDDQINFKRDKFKSGFKPMVFGDIRLTGFNSRQRNYVRKMFKKRDSEITIEQIKAGYYKLISESYFKNIFPNIIYNQVTGNFDLEIEAKQAKNFKVDLGGNISTRGISQVFLGFQLNHFHSFLGSYDFNFYTGRFYQSIQAKPRFNFPSNKLVYLEPEVTLNSWNYIDGSDVVFGQTNRPVLNQTDRKYGLNLGIAAGNKGKIIWQASHINNTDHFGNSAFFLTSDTLDVLKFRGFRYGVAYSRNTLNRKQYADAGSQVYASIDFIDGTETYRPGSSSYQLPVENLAHQWFKFTGRVEKYYTLNPVKIGIYMETVLSNQPLFTNYKASLINSPSFLPLQDSRSVFLEKYRAFNYSALGLKNVVRLSRSLDLRAEGYIFKPFDQILDREDHIPELNSISDIHWVGNLNMVYHTVLGPVSLSFNYYPSHTQKFGLLLHLGYVLYNKKSME